MNGSVVDSGPLTGLILDLHLPASVSAWPLAPGWWLVAALLALFLCWLFRVGGYHNKFGLSSKRQHTATLSLVSSTRQHLQQNYEHWQRDQLDTRYLQQTNLVLKRFVISHDLQSVASATQTRLPVAWHGNVWVDWMQQSVAASLSDAAARGLAEHCYRAEETLPSLPVQKIHAELLQWVSRFDERHHA